MIVSIEACYQTKVRPTQSYDLEILYPRSWLGGWLDTKATHERLLNGRYSEIESRTARNVQGLVQLSLVGSAVAEHREAHSTILGVHVAKRNTLDEMRSDKMR